LISQDEVTGSGSAVSLLPTLLKLAARGSLKVKPILLTIALLIAINVGAHTMVNSYEKEVTTLMALYSGREYLTVSEKPTPGALMILVTPYEMSGRRILLVYSEDVKTLLGLSGASASGALPVRDDEVLVGESIRDLVERNAIVVNGRPFKVTGHVRSSDHLTYSIVGLATPRSDAQPLYVSLRRERDGAFSAPAIELVTKSLFVEVLRVMGSVRFLLYVVLGLSCFFQGYNSLVEAEHVLRVFASLSTPRKMAGGSIFLYACLISISGAATGFSIGLFTPGLLSSFTSVLFRLPHLKPLVDLSVGYDLVWGVAASLPALFAGLLWGYSKQIASD